MSFDKIDMPVIPGNMVQRIREKEEQEKDKMKYSIRKSKRNIERKILLGVLVAGAIYLGIKNYDDISEAFKEAVEQRAKAAHVITDSEFENAKWIKYHNKDGRLWDEYTGVSNVHPQNQDNWHKYVNKVRERNHGKLEGEIEIPLFK